MDRTLPPRMLFYEGGRAVGAAVPIQAEKRVLYRGAWIDGDGHVHQFGDPGVLGYVREAVEIEIDSRRETEQP